MIIEYIRYEMTTHSGRDLVAAYEKASVHLRACEKCLGYELTQCEEAPTSFILRIKWTSTKDHLEGFRRGPHFRPFLSEISKFVPEISEMRHYALTSVVSTA